MITKSTTTVYLTTLGVAFDNLADAQARELADIWQAVFADAGLPAGNNVAIAASQTLGKHFASIGDKTLQEVTKTITDARTEPADAGADAQIQSP